jgi:hypothetical protein
VSKIYILETIFLSNKNGKLKKKSQFIRKIKKKYFNLILIGKSKEKFRC